jgi:hypothetical protein
MGAGFDKFFEFGREEFAIGCDCPAVSGDGFGV